MSANKIRGTNIKILRAQQSCILCKLSDVVIELDFKIHYEWELNGTSVLGYSSHTVVKLTVTHYLILHNIVSFIEDISIIIPINIDRFCG